MTTIVVLGPTHCGEGGEGGGEGEGEGEGRGGGGGGGGEVEVLAKTGTLCHYTLSTVREVSNSYHNTIARFLEGLQLFSRLYHFGRLAAVQNFTIFITVGLYMYMYMCTSTCRKYWL